MSFESKIEWTNATWNPVTGCSFISEGCRNCYAKRMARRLQAMGVLRYKSGFDVCVHDDLIEVPLKWKKPRFIFVNSMGDIFHKSVPTEFIERIFFTIKQAPWHTFQILTKRADRLENLSLKLQWPQNLWMGVTVESQEHISRIDKLRSVPASIRFISFEPLLGPIESPNLGSIDWVIVGGESGPYARPMSVDWARMIRDVCLENSIPFFFKQWGGIRKKEHGRILDRRTWTQFPALDANRIDGQNSP